MPFHLCLEKIHLKPTGKNCKIKYYIQCWLRNFSSKSALLNYRIKQLQYWKSRPDVAYIRNRVSYYNKLQQKTKLSTDPKKISDIPNGIDVYNRDAYEILRYFDPTLKLETVFYDNTSIPVVPAICKSRPIRGLNENAVLLNMCKVRHFIFLKDKIPFRNKLDKAIFRGAVCQSHRIRFMKQNFENSLIDCADTSPSSKFPQWKKKEITLYDHLRFKFIVSLEGNDVASNLKWVMSSNSIAIMPRPTYETWFMEGKLIPNVHYIEIEKDYSDIEEKILWYSNHLEASEKIIHHAHQWISQFQNPERELLIALLVMQKYFTLTNQDTEEFRSCL